MESIVEGKLKFEFNPNSNALVGKYDEWSFYRNQLSKKLQGYKAMDIVFVESDYTWLIEIKDYRQGYDKLPRTLIDEVKDKVRDTLVGLVGAKHNANDENERNIATQALQKKLKIVLHLEYPQKNRDFVADIKQELKRQLKPLSPHLYVVNKSSLTSQIGQHWTVSSSP